MRLIILLLINLFNSHLAFSAETLREEMICFEDRLVDFNVYVDYDVNDVCLSCDMIFDSTGGASGGMSAITALCTSQTLGAKDNFDIILNNDTGNLSNSAEYIIHGESSNTVIELGDKIVNKSDLFDSNWSFCNVDGTNLCQPNSFSISLSEGHGLGSDFNIGNILALRNLSYSAPNGNNIVSAGTPGTTVFVLPPDSAPILEKEVFWNAYEVSSATGDLSNCNPFTGNFSLCDRSALATHISTIDHSTLTRVNKTPPTPKSFNIASSSDVVDGVPQFKGSRVSISTVSGSNIRNYFTESNSSVSGFNLVKRRRLCDLIDIPCPTLRSESGSGSGSESESGSSGGVALDCNFSTQSSCEAAVDSSSNNVCVWDDQASTCLAPFIAKIDISRAGTTTGNSSNGDLANVTRTVFFPLYQYSTYDFEIDWGDGTKERYKNSTTCPSCNTETYVDGVKFFYTMSHTYSTDGEKTIKIYGQASWLGWSTYSSYYWSNDPPKIPVRNTFNYLVKEIVQFGDLGTTNFGRLISAWNGWTTSCEGKDPRTTTCENVIRSVKSGIFGNSSGISLHEFAANAQFASGTTLDLSTVQNISSAYQAFRRTRGLKKIDLSNVDWSGTTNLQSAFNASFYQAGSPNSISEPVELHLGKIGNFTPSLSGSTSTYLLATLTYNSYIGSLQSTVHPPKIYCTNDDGSPDNTTEIYNTMDSSGDLFTPTGADGDSCVENNDCSSNKCVAVGRCMKVDGEEIFGKTQSSCNRNGCVYTDSSNNKIVVDISSSSCATHSGGVCLYAYGYSNFSTKDSCQSAYPYFWWDADTVTSYTKCRGWKVSSTKTTAADCSTLPSIWHPTWVPSGGTPFSYESVWSFTPTGGKICNGEIPSLKCQGHPTP